MRVTEEGLYGALVDVLRATKEPLTCVAIYEAHENVREFAATPNRVSDYLGGLFRKGLVSRIPNQHTASDGSRWAYMWRHEKDASRFDPVTIESSARTLVNRPEIQITDTGKTITIDLPNLSITIKVKN